MISLILGLAALAALGLAASNRRRLDALGARVAALEGRAVAGRAGAASRRRVDPAAPAPTATARPTLIEVPNLASKGSGAADAPGQDGRFAPIRALAEAGASAEAIARETGQPIGQVELILGLDRSRPDARSGRRRGARPS